MKTTHEPGTARPEWLPRTAAWAGVLLLVVVGNAWRIEASEAGTLTEENVAQHIATATTAADHETLATFYRSQATAKADQVKEHEAMLKSYDNVAGTSKELMRSHCQILIQSFRQAQQAYQNLARQHEQLAKEAGGGH